ncbi:hypothetical protein NKH77_04665 [Streptomyces sp. M19]
MDQQREWRGRVARDRRAGPGGLKTVNYCPNYSSALLPSTDGTRLLEIATDLDGSTCKPYFATGTS